MTTLQTPAEPASTRPQTLPEPTARIAVATKGTGLVDVHFGHATGFDIYDVTRAGAEFLEARTVAPYCHGQDNGPGDLEPILTALADCQAVLVSRIGSGPDDRLAAAGIEPVQTYNTVENALFDYYDQWRSRAE